MPRSRPGLDGISDNLWEAKKMTNSDQEHEDQMGEGVAR